MILNKINTLIAALKPSQYRKYWKIRNEKFYTDSNKEAENIVRYIKDLNI